MSNVKVRWLSDWVSEKVTYWAVDNNLNLIYRISRMLSHIQSWSMLYSVCTPPSSWHPRADFWVNFWEMRIPKHPCCRSNIIGGLNFVDKILSTFILQYHYPTAVLWHIVPCQSILGSLWVKACNKRHFDHHKSRKVLNQIYW